MTRVLVTFAQWLRTRSTPLEGDAPTSVAKRALRDSRRLESCVSQVSVREELARLRGEGKLNFDVYRDQEISSCVWNNWRQARKRIELRLLRIGERAYGGRAT